MAVQTPLMPPRLVARFMELELHLLLRRQAQQVKY
jgi:hypothetical protein